MRLTIQVSCLFYFLLLSRFFKGKVKSVLLAGFIAFLSGLFSKAAAISCNVKVMHDDNAVGLVETY